MSAPPAAPTTSAATIVPTIANGVLAARIETADGDQDQRPEAPGTGQQILVDVALLRGERDRAARDERQAPEEEPSVIVHGVPSPSSSDSGNRIRPEIALVGAPCGIGVDIAGARVVSSAGGPDLASLLCGAARRNLNEETY
jgi:hypothetical protein